MGRLSRLQALRRGLRVEGPRVWTSSVPAVVAGLLLGLLTTGDTGPQGAAESVVLVMMCYQLSYLLLTAVAWSGADHADVEAAAEKMPRRGRTLLRWNRTGEPGAGTALGVGFLAMIVALVVLPRADTVADRFPPAVLTLLCVLLIVGAWGTSVVTYAVDYLRIDHHDGGLQFPDADPRVFTDYLYFSLNVATTFGTTDVSVVRADLRRVIIGQALVAFAFSAVIISLSVTALAS